MFRWHHTRKSIENLLEFMKTRGKSNFNTQVRLIKEKSNKIKIS